MLDWTLMLVCARSAGNMHAPENLRTFSQKYSRSRKLTHVQPKILTLPKTCARLAENTLAPENLKTTSTQKSTAGKSCRALKLSRQQRNSLAVLVDQFFIVFVGSVDIAAQENGRGKSSIGHFFNGFSENTI